MTTRQPDESEIARIFRAEYGRAVAVLNRSFGDLDVAEDAVQDAFAAAVRRWPSEGVPPSPAGWIITTARNRAIDRLRREAKRDRKHGDAMFLYGPHPTGSGRAPADPEVGDPKADHDQGEEGPVTDDRLRLIFTCCHPALATTAQVALTLRLLGGLTTTEIAHAFLVPEPTMAQRIVRAKKKIKSARIPYRVPEESELPDRVKPVLAVIYLIFNEGYAASAGDELARDDLTEEAIRLGRLLVQLMPDEPEALGLLGLMLLTQARRPARVGASGELVPLGEQDRSRWDPELIEQGRQLVRQCLRRNRPGPYQLQAAIGAVHSDAATLADTDWRQILQLHDQWYALSPTPLVALNRAVVVGEVHGPEAGLAEVERIELPDNQHWHSARAELLRRHGRTAEARRALDRAIDLAGNTAEQAVLISRREQLAPPAT